MRWTIQGKLAAVVLAALLPLVAGATFKFWRDLAQERTAAQDNLLATAELVARQLDEVMNGQVEDLEALASVRALARIKDEDLRTLATRVQARHPFVRRFYAVDGNGRVTASSERIGARGSGISLDPALLKTVMSEATLRVGAPRRIPPSGATIVPLVVPVLDTDGKSLGVVAEDIDLPGLSTFLDSIRIGRGTSLAVRTVDGQLLARAGEATAGHGAAPAGSAQPRAYQAIAAKWRGDEGVPSLARSAMMSVAPWTVVAAMPSDLAYAPAAARLHSNLLGLGGATLVALIVAWIMSRPMTRAVQALMKGVRGLASGEASTITVPTRDELAELAGQFNQAIAERRQAEAAIDARQRRIRAFAEINLALSRQLDPERLLRQITDALAQLTGAPNVVLWEADLRERLLVRRASTTDSSVGSIDLPETLTMDQGATGWIARQRQPLFVEDVTLDPRVLAVDWALRRDLVAFAGVPVIAGDELLGVLTLNLLRGSLPPADDRALLPSFAAQAAVAIRNARLFAEAEARRRAAETLSALGRTLSQALDPIVVAQRIVESVRALLDVQNSALYRVEPESGDLVALAFSGDGVAMDRALTLVEGTGVAGLAARHGQPVATSNVLLDTRVTLSPEMRAVIEQAPHRAILAVPLLVKNTVIGTLGVGAREGRRFQAEEIHLLQAFADQAALALDNARLYEETQERLQHLDSLRDVIEQILVPVSLEARLTTIARKTAELFAADRVAIALRDGGGGELVVRAGHGLAAREVGRTVPSGVGAEGVAADERRGVLVNDYLAWPPRDPFIVHAYLARPRQAAIAYPLLIRDQVIGALSVSVHEPLRPFVAADLDRLATLAVPAALAIEHSRLYEELEARVRELEETQAQLVQAGKLSAVGQLVSGVAHEINNPLSVVIGYGQLLMRRDLPRELRRPIELIVAQGDRISRIVQSLLLFSRQRRPERAAVDVRAEMEQILGLRATQLMLSGIHIEASYGDDVPDAEGDAHQLQQVFLNLLLNAEQAILGSGVGADRVGDRISVGTTTRTDAERTWVVVTVADNGPGIPGEILPRIFEPFFTTKNVGQGTGLGLSVSYGIIQQHGGRLTVTSRPSHTVFTVELPVAEESRPMAPAAVDATTGTGHGRHALVVDDEPDVLELVTTLLSQAGWQVDGASGGHAALERLRQERYDLVVSDVRMPELSGETLYRMVTTEHRDLAARFVFMTGDTANPAAWEFLQRARAHVIEKPFTAAALLQAVERVTADSAAS